MVIGLISGNDCPQANSDKANDGNPFEDFRRNPFAELFADHNADTCRQHQRRRRAEENRPLVSFCFRGKQAWWQVGFCRQFQPRTP